MSQYQAIPRPNDQRNVSQNDILQNFAYINNADGAPASGVFPVDHLSTGDNVSNQACGFHQQVSFINRSPAPTTLVNAVNSQTSDSITYSFADGAGNSQLRFLNTWKDQPVTFIKCAGIIDSSGTVQGNPFNIASTVKNGPGDYTINFATAMPSINYIVVGSVLSGTATIGSPSSRVLTYRQNLLASVTLSVTTAGTATNPQAISFMVIGFF